MKQSLESASSDTRPGGAATENGGRIAALDGVRGVAILLVLAHNAFASVYDPAPDSALILRVLDHLAEIGWVGVTLFFVLSGYLIGRILFAHRDAPNYFSTFYLRRTCRILPLYLVVVGPVIVGGLVSVGEWAPGLGRHLTSGDVAPAWYAGFVQNIGMFVSGSWGERWLATTWSLAVEEQFYILGAFVFRWSSPKRLVGVLCGLIVASPFIRTALILLFPHRNAEIGCYTLLPARWDAIALGALVGLAAANAPAAQRVTSILTRSWRALLILLSVTCSVLWIAAPAPLGAVNATVGHSAYAALFALGLWVIVTQPSKAWSVLRVRWLGWIGVISYGVYLLHEPVLSLLFKLGLKESRVLDEISDLPVILLGLGATFALASVSWLLFERPIVALGHRLRYDRSQERAASAQRAELPAAEPSAG